MRGRGIPPALSLTRRSSTSRTLRPGASPVRFATRKMCVSTAIVGSPKAEFMTTFAVLRPTPGRRFERRAFARHFAAVPRENRPGRLQDVLRLHAPQTDRADVAGEACLAERDHRRGRTGDAEQRARRQVHALVGRLRRKDDGNEELVGRAVRELGGGLRHRRAQPLEQRLPGCGSEHAHAAPFSRHVRAPAGRHAHRSACGSAARVRRPRRAAAAPPAGPAPGSCGCSPPGMQARRVRSRCSPRR